MNVAIVIPDGVLLLIPRLHYNRFSDSIFLPIITLVNLQITFQLLAKRYM